MYWLQLTYALWFISGALSTDGGGSQGHAYKILFYSDIGSRSHVKNMLEIGQELNRLNHNFSYVSWNNNREYLVDHPTVPFIDLGEPINMAGIFQKNNLDYVASNQIEELARKNKLLTKLAEAAYAHSFDGLANVIASEKPDLMICDFMAPCCADLAKLLSVPLVTGFQSTDGFHITKSPDISDGQRYAPLTTYNLSLWERLLDAVAFKSTKSEWEREMRSSLNKVRRLKGLPPSRHMYGDFSNSLVLANTFIGFEPAFKLAPNLKLIGPIKYTKEPPQLTRELVEFMDLHDRVVYIAFGSQFKLTTNDITKLIATSVLALEEGTVDGVVWGLGNTDPETFPRTVMVSNQTLEADSLLNNEHPHFKLLRWAPQISILNHKSTKLFISHGGMESIFEGILSKTPILCMALAADQPRNARKLEDAGIGRYIDRFAATPPQFSKNIAEIILDESRTITYSLDRMYTLATSQANSIQAPVHLLLDYINLAKVCRPGHPPIPFDGMPCEMLHMALSSDNMTYIQANNLDVYFLIGLIIICSALGMSYVFISLFKKNRNRYATVNINPKSLKLH